MHQVIREQTEADIYDVAFLGVLAAAHRDGKELPDAPPPRALAAWRTVFARPGFWGLLCLAGDLLVAEVSGFAIDQAGEPAARSRRHYISSLSVRPDVWGRGHGRTILNAAVDYLRRHEVTEAEAWVLRNNAHAKSVYGACGFIDTGRSAAYGATLTDEMLLRLSA